MGDILPATAFERDMVFGCGLKSTGGLKALSAAMGEPRSSDDVFAGPVFDGDIDLALSAKVVVSSWSAFNLCELPTKSSCLPLSSTFQELLIHTSRCLVPSLRSSRDPSQELINRL